MSDYRKGRYELGGGCYAWLVPDGSWGFSNSGLIASQGESLLIDTHFDLALTEEMLEGMRPVTDANPIRYLLNTHANGDHYFGNQLLGADVEILASAATQRDMHQDDVERLSALKAADGAVGDFVRHIFGPFDFDPVRVRAADRTFERELALRVGDVDVQLVLAGPAHTPGDTFAWVPEAGVLYAGDLVFVGGTPIVWAGPTQNWIDACDQMLALGPQKVVPGHGPLTDRSGIEEVRAYLEFVLDYATSAAEAGKPVDAAIDDVQLGRFGEWAESSRIVRNIVAVYEEVVPGLESMSQAELFSRMAAIEGFTEKKGSASA